MARIVSIHSFRGGTGKSNLTANIAAAVAATGKRVGIIDSDIQSPGIHVLFGFDEDRIQKSLNDFLWGMCPIQDAAYDVSACIGNGTAGKVYLIPSSINAGQIARVLREGFDVSLLNDGLHQLIAALTLDYLFIDTHPGINEETLLSIAMSNALLLVLRPDQQDYQGTAVTVDIARRLHVPDMKLVVNKLVGRVDLERFTHELEGTYNVPVAGVLPLSEAMMSFGSAGLFCLRQPDDPFSQAVRGVVKSVLNGAG